MQTLPKSLHNTLQGSWNNPPKYLLLLTLSLTAQLLLPISLQS